MIPYSSYAHSIAVVPPTLRQSTETHQNQHVDWALFGWGFLIILMLLGSRQLAIAWYRAHQWHRSVILLQRRAALEHVLALKAAAKKPLKKASFNSPKAVS